MAAPGTDAAALQRLAAARAAVLCLQSMQAHRVAAATPPPAAGGRAAAPPPPRDGGSRNAGGGAVAPALALRRRRPPPLAAMDAGSSASRRAKWAAVARRQRGGSSSAKSLDSLVMLERDAVGGDEEDGEDVPGFDSDGLAADASVDRRPGDGGASAATPRWFANSGKAHTYDVARVDKAGVVAKQELKRRELLRETGLPARDLRRIDPALSLTTSAPTLLVSDTVLLINLGQVRVIVSRDHALLFEPHTRVARNFLDGLLSRLSVPQTALNGDADGDAGFTETAPFELEVVEAALLEVTGQLDTLLLDASARVAQLLRLLPQRLAITAEVLEELRLVKQSLVELDSRAGAIRSLLLEVLDDEEDVRGMMLSRPAAAPPAEVEEAEDEVENLLEYYLQRCETCHGEAERLLENTRDLEESISVSLSARRFEVNKLELMLSIATFATAVGALVAGIFGMNLRNRFELSVGAFYGTAAGIMFGVVLLCVALFRYTRRKRIL